MRSSMHDQLPVAVRRSLQKFGGDLGIARRKRRLTAATMAERIGVAASTYARMEKGDPSVCFGAYAMALFVLGFAGALNELIDVRRDDHGLLLDQERIPRRVRSPRRPEGV